ncbi:hypothetical protein SDC9_17696 [bioreactor metagenome]|uniref:Uncharacterized protein n=1 Tax=bioreactor metagenome TaxID=1076179 RepID=A0A644TZN6_9ZZZZ
MINSRKVNFEHYPCYEIGNQQADKREQVNLKYPAIISGSRCINNADKVCAEVPQYHRQRQRNKFVPVPQKGEYFSDQFHVIACLPPVLRQ